VTCNCCNLLVGRRAVYTKIASRYDEQRREHVEVSRELFHGTIAALVTIGSYNYSAVVMLWDDGTLSSHDIATITVEGASPDGVLR
jgi:hypothetical protein